MAESLPPTRAGRGHEETAVFETLVVPRYLSFFGERTVHKLVAGKDARVCHLRCGTGYPDRDLIEKLPNAHVHGVDPSPYAIELARAKALTLVEGRAGIAFDYRVGELLPLPFPAGVFSHAFTLHAPHEQARRLATLDELVRLVAPRGQVVLAMPLRGSFAALHDLLRECALKHELDGLSAAVDAAVAERPNEDVLARELEAAGLDKVEVDVRTRTMRFEGGRRFFEDPVTRLVLLPELRAELGEEADPIGPLDPFVYVRDAIDKYWSEATFELDVIVGVASGRKR